MLSIKKIYLIVVVVSLLSAPYFPVRTISAASASGCEGGTVQPGKSCTNPLYVCAGNYNVGYTCVCRWGDFESIDLGLVSNLSGTSICDAFVGSVSSNKRGAVIYLLNYFIIMLVALVIMVALVSILVGGYIYMTAGGSADRVKVAKTWIVSAILGIVIALSAWIILGVINPYLLGG